MPPPFMLNAPASKNFPLPIILHPPLSGRFVGRMLLRPYPRQQKTKDEQRKNQVPGQIVRHPRCLDFLFASFSPYQDKKRM